MALLEYRKMSGAIRCKLASERESLESISEHLLNERKGLKSLAATRILYKRVVAIRLWYKIKHVLDILNKTDIHLLDGFLDLGGWNLINSWLKIMQEKKMTAAPNALVKEGALVIQSMILHLIKDRVSLNKGRYLSFKTHLVDELATCGDEQIRRIARELLKKWTYENVLRSSTSLGMNLGHGQNDPRETQSSKKTSPSITAPDQTSTPNKKRKQDENAETKTKSAKVQENLGKSNPGILGTLEGQRNSDNTIAENSKQNEKNLQSQVINGLPKNQDAIHEKRIISESMNSSVNNSSSDPGKAIGTLVRSSENVAKTSGTSSNQSATLIKGISNSEERDIDNDIQNSGSGQKSLTNAPIETSERSNQEPLNLPENTTISTALNEEGSKDGSPSVLNQPFSGDYQENGQNFTEKDHMPHCEDPAYHVMKITYHSYQLGKIFKHSAPV